MIHTRQTTEGYQNRQTTMAILSLVTWVARRSLGRLKITSHSASVTSLTGRTAIPNYVSQSASQRIYKRTMSMVTQTKASDLPSYDEVANTTNSGDNTETFNQLTDALIVTPSCLQRVQALIKQRQKKSEDASKSFLRVYVDAGGCSGFQYQFEFDDDIDEEDDVIVVDNQDSDARVVIDNTSLGFLNGSTLDYVQEMIKSSFVIIDNPQSESACGCGSSFAVKNFESNPALD
jgi:iron-sulfur cluster assembly accessory protein